MMTASMNGRRIHIDKEKCDGCGLCVSACHEGALAIIDGKAEVVREDVCDGFGDCLPACPHGAITLYNPAPPSSLSVPVASPEACLMAEPGYQWPIQMALVPEKSDFFRGTIVVAADCTAFATEGFRERFIEGNAVIIGCPKLDDRRRFEKLSTILTANPIDRIRVIRMEVPCCRAITSIVREAASSSGRSIVVEETIVSRSGSVISMD